MCQSLYGVKEVGDPVLSVVTIPGRATRKNLLTGARPNNDKNVSDMKYCRIKIKIHRNSRKSGSNGRESMEGSKQFVERFTVAALQG